MPTLKSVMDDAALQCSAPLPTSWVASTHRTHLEMKLHLRKTVDELLERIDWPDPITQTAIITGDGSASYALPEDCKRLTYDPMAVYEATSTRRAGIPVATSGAWSHLLQIGSAGADRFYRLTGDEDAGYAIEFYRPLSINESVTVSYISKNWMRSFSGVPGLEWTEEGDVPLLPSRAIELGVTWRFRQKKGVPYADIMAEYEIVVSRKGNQANQLKSINMAGGDPDRRPWDIPVPDYVPPA